MYTPPYFQEQDAEKLAGFIRRYGFGLLLSQGPESVPNVTHLPLELVTGTSHWVLEGHMARANPQWRHWQDGQEVLAVFTGPQAYVSPTWYDHPNVPTWNYTTVHVRGTAQVLTDEEDIRTLLDRNVARYEAPDSPYRVDQLPPVQLAGLLKAITPFRITVTHVEGTMKLSQNRDAVNRRRVIEGLYGGGEEARTLAAFMDAYLD